MGAKTSAVYGMLVGMAMIFQTIAAFIRWHVLTVNPFGVTIMRLNTGLFFTRVEQGLILMCGWNKEWKECEEMQDGITLQEAANKWCSPLLTDVLQLTAPCNAYNSAYILGMVCGMAIIMNFLLLVAAAALLFQYFNSSKHKPEYRRWAFILHAVATGILFLTFLAWSFHTLPALDHIGASKGMVSGGLGVSYGYCIMCAGILFQSIAAALFSFMPVGNEMTEDERMLHKLAKEQAHLAASQPNQQPAAYYGAAPVPGAGPPPQATYGYGYGAPPGPQGPGSNPMHAAW